MSSGTPASTRTPAPSGAPASTRTPASASAPAPIDDLTAFLVRLTGLLLRSSGEGAHLIGVAVTDSARGLGGDASLLLVPEAATLTVVAADGRTRTATVHGFPEVFRLDRTAALKPLLADVREGRVDVTEAGRRLAGIETAPAPYPWWAKFLGIVLFSLGFAPLMQPTWYEVGSTAALASIAAALAVAADRVPRPARVLPLVVSTTVSIVTIELFAGDPAHGGPVLLMLPALFFFVPGDYLSAAAAELAAGLVTTGAIRLVYAAFLLVQLCVGVLLGVYVTGTSTRALFDLAAASDLPRWALFLAWIVFTAGTVLAFAVPRRHFWPLLLLVYVTVGVQSLATKLVGEVAGTFLAAVVLAAAATLLSRGPRRPPRLLLVLPGFFTLTVGSLGMRGLTTLAGGYVVEGFTDLLKLVVIVTAIAVGLVVGATLVPETAPPRTAAPPDTRTTA
ncbi:threonine/serine exporter family protein [Streptomyces sp. NPDC093111]|uniref:threonine/serine exporter family protein n=1 Tax=Streptomyces sp. NPDC093111 TaxID=3154978 RepID=UPI00341A8E19